MAAPSQDPDNSERSTWRMIGEYTGLAVTLPGAVVIGYGLGYLLDRVFHTGRVFTITFLFLGGIAGLIEIVRVASRWQNREEERRND
jgi:F0F1-type ATP synthase assembly protein I